MLKPELEKKIREWVTVSTTLYGTMEEWMQELLDEIDSLRCTILDQEYTIKMLLDSPNEVSEDIFKQDQPETTNTTRKLIDYMEMLWKKYKEEHKTRTTTGIVKNSEYYYSFGRLNTLEHIIYFVKKLKWESLEEEKTVARWAYPSVEKNGKFKILFTEEMTKEAAIQKYGSYAVIVPGSEESR